MTTPHYTFEICANSVESAEAAQAGGAQRVELCAGIPEGGTTPSIATIRKACETLEIRVHPIIRPRGGDFLYTPLEVEIMEEDIRQAVDAGAHGVVIGCLLPDGTLDHRAMRRLVDAARGRSVTCHRAFDYVADPLRVIDELVDLGVERILTSGQQATALLGVECLAQCVRHAHGRIIIMPGCGVNEENIAEIARRTGAEEFHFSARTKKESRMLLRNPALYMGDQGVDEYAVDVTSAERVRRTISALRGF